MEISRAVVCRVDADGDEFEKLKRTVEAFDLACNYISEVAFTRRCFDRIALHDLIYRKVRSAFKLPASLAVRARDRVIDAYNLDRSRLRVFRQMSIILDGRVFRLLRGREIRASVATIGGRIKLSLAAGDYQRKLLENPAREARLSLRNGVFTLAVFISREVPERKIEEPVGVDVGIRKLLAASNGFTVKGGAMKARRRHFDDLKNSLRTKGTSSARRRLKRLSLREGRWLRTLLHQVSRSFVDSLGEGEYAVLERLYRTKERGRQKRVRGRRVFQSWAICSLQRMICYKCSLEGIPVIFVKPDYTSQRCPRCGTIDRNNRRTQALFRCVCCGFQHNADFVASLNLRELARGGWAAVSQPNAIYEIRKPPSMYYDEGAADHMKLIFW